MESSLLEDLSSLDLFLSRATLPKAQRNWGGAETCVSREAPPPPRQHEFYPDPRYVVTHHDLELSWLIEKLKEVFMGRGLIDFETKFEFFGRLSNAANLCLHENSLATAHVLCAAVLHEAYAIAVDLESGDFQRHRQTFNREHFGELFGVLADDSVALTFRSGFMSIDSTLDFFRGRGITIFGTV